LCQVESESSDVVVRVGKCSCEADDAIGEFIGLCKVSSDNVAKMVAAYHEAREAHEPNPEKSFVRAKTWAQSYLCDLLEYMAREKGVEMRPVYIDGGWREIDTVQDKTRADETVDW
jgi:L-glutamine-phosphate cytidylyltransferase